MKCFKCIDRAKFLCGNCKTQSYCSEKCAKQDWVLEKHYLICGKTDNQKSLVIQTQDGRYLKPGPKPASFNAQSSVMGSVIVSKTPYKWNFDGQHITSQEGWAWDFWDNKNPQLILWKTLNQGATQKIRLEKDRIALATGYIEITVNGNVTISKVGTKFLFTEDNSYMVKVSLSPPDYIYGKLLNANADALFEMAEKYVKEQGLDWKIQKPRVWSMIGPHLTLDRKFKGNLGQTFSITLGNISHFTDFPSRWVVLDAKVPAPWGCGPYPCHVSIGQQRLDGK